jgi:hypothetical protein
MKSLGSIVLTCAALACVAPAAAHADDLSKRSCVYTAHKIDKLNAFGQMVGRDMDCALVFNDASPDWAGWENPWFLHHPDPNLNWAHWATAPGTSRQLIITQNLFPSALNSTDWRHAGARGDYTSHAVNLAKNLVTSGLGNAVIRLGHEANGTWYPDSIGSTDADFALWVQFWRNTVLAMKSVPGANFHFDWCVNAAWRPIALSKFYPGDDVVDYVGIDAYDSGIAATVTDRWATVWSRTGGVRDVLNFAIAHNKPLSIPEWGVGTAGLSSLAGGDDPAYVDGIASIVRNYNVAYQSYFSNYEWAAELANGPLSLAAYRRHFGANGDSVGTVVSTTIPSKRSAAKARETRAKHHRKHRAKHSQRAKHRATRST